MAEKFLIKKKVNRRARPGRPEATAALALTNDELEACEQFRDNVDNLLRRIKRKYGFSNQELATLLYPYVSDASELSRILSENRHRKDKRHFKLEGIPTLYYLFNESIDELIAFEHEPRPDFRRPPTNFS